MDFLGNFLQDNALITQIVGYVVIGAWLPAIVTLIGKALNSDPVRKPVGAALYAWGAVSSRTMAKLPILRGQWNSLEGALQDFTRYCVDRFFAGLDSDDKETK